MDPLIIAIIVAVFTLIVLFSGIPIAFGLSFVSIVLLVSFEGFQMLDVFAVVCLRVALHLGDNDAAGIVKEVKGFWESRQNDDHEADNEDPGKCQEQQWGGRRRARRLWQLSGGKEARPCRCLAPVRSRGRPPLRC